MGPVSFEAIDVGEERGAALEAAAILRSAGIRVDLTEPGSAGGTYRLMVRSHDARRAHAALSGADRADDGPARPGS